jgi:hypothetical protein
VQKAGGVENIMRAAALGQASKPQNEAWTRSFAGGPVTLLKSALQIDTSIAGEVAEWSNVPDSKSGVPQGTVGSNPTLSASSARRYVAELTPVSSDFYLHGFLSKHRDALRDQIRQRHSEWFALIETMNATAMEVMFSLQTDETSSTAKVMAVTTS